MSQDNKRDVLRRSHKTKSFGEPKTCNDLHSHVEYPNDRNLIEERIDAYLEGWMESEEAAVFERDLLRPEIAEAFGKELMLRDLLATTPEVELPSYLIEEIESALQVASLQADTMIESLNSRRPSRSKAEKRVGKERTERYGWLKNAFTGLKWSVRGPTFALQATSGKIGLTAGSVGSLTTMASGSRGAASGLSSLRYALGSPTEQKVRSTKSRAQQDQQKERRNKKNNKAGTRQRRVGKWFMSKLKAAGESKTIKQEARKSNIRKSKTWKSKARKTLWSKAMKSLRRQ